MLAIAEGVIARAFRWLARLSPFIPSLKDADIWLTDEELEELEYEQYGKQVEVEEEEEYEAEGEDDEPEDPFFGKLREIYDEAFQALEAECDHPECNDPLNLWARDEESIPTWAESIYYEDVYELPCSWCGLPKTVVSWDSTFGFHVCKVCDAIL